MALYNSSELLPYIIWHTFTRLLFSAYDDFFAPLTIVFLHFTKVAKIAPLTRHSGGCYLLADQATAFFSRSSVLPLQPDCRNRKRERERKKRKEEISSPGNNMWEVKKLSGNSSSSRRQTTAAQAFQQGYKCQLPLSLRLPVIVRFHSLLYSCICSSTTNIAAQCRS